MEALSKECRRSVAEAVRELDESYVDRVAHTNSRRRAGVRSARKGEVFFMPMTDEEVAEAVSLHRLALLNDVRDILFPGGGGRFAIPPDPAPPAPPAPLARSRL